MKKLINVLAIIVVVIFAGYNVHKAQQPVVLSDVAMENVEALADDEIDVELPEVTITCGQKGGKCWIEAGYCYVGEYTFKKCEFTGKQAWSCFGNC